MSTKRQLTTPTWLDLLIVNGLTVIVILLILFGGGCGIVTGNPEKGDGTALAGFEAPSDFQAPIDEFNASTATSCGSFSYASTVAEFDAGELCIRDALAKCTAAKFLLDETNPENQRFVSFVEVIVKTTAPLTCEVSIHVVSNNPDTFFGDKKATCSAIPANEKVELACGLE